MTSSLAGTKAADQLEWIQRWPGLPGPCSLDRSYVLFWHLYILVYFEIIYLLRWIFCDYICCSHNCPRGFSDSGEEVWLERGKHGNTHIIYLKSNCAFLVNVVVLSLPVNNIFSIVYLWLKHKKRVHLSTLSTSGY